MRDLICDVITRCVWSWDTGKINASDKIRVENQQKKRNVTNLMPEEVLRSFTVILTHIASLRVRQCRSWPTFWPQ